MTGRDQDHRTRRAFTLLEVLTVLLVTGLMLGLFVGLMVQFTRDDTLSRAAVDVEQLARRASRLATMEGQGVIVLAGRSGFQLRTPEGGAEVLPLPEGVKLELRPWRGRGWQRADGYAWRFDRRGLGEPLSVRLSRDEAWVELDFHPLTGAVSAKRAYLP